MSSRIPIVALGCLGLLASACVRIDGGSVELSWVLHANGRAINDCGCADPKIGSVRIHLVGKGGAIEGATPCDGRAQCEFSCQRQTGATPFDIQPTQGDERYAVSVIAVGLDGADLPQVDTPAPILRTVTRGQPTEVAAFLLQVVCHADCESMNKSGVCARP